MYKRENSARGVLFKYMDVLLILNFPYRRTLREVYEETGIKGKVIQREESTGHFE